MKIFARVNLAVSSTMSYAFIISFRVGNTDAQALTREFGTAFARETFTSLDRFRIIAHLNEDGQTPEPFQAATLAPINFNPGRREKLIARSREKYAAPRAIVEEKINRWMDAPDGSKLRQIQGKKIPFLFV